MKKLLIFLPALLLMATAVVCISCDGASAGRAKVATDSIVCEVTVFSDDIVRVVKYPVDGAEAAATKGSFSVIMEPQSGVKVARTETDDAITLKTAKIELTVAKADAQVTFKDAVTGENLLAETATTFEPRPAGDVDEGKYRVGQTWDIPQEEFLYGMGQRQDPDLSLRGKNIHLWNDNKYIYIPFFCSEKGYGVYWDNPGMTDFIDEGSTTLIKSEVGVCSDLYFIYGGGSIDALIADERALGGKATLFPLWAHGYWQCRERYHSTEELCEALRQHRLLGIPIDCIVQDWQYWGPNSNWNSMRFDNPEYARADTMIDFVHRNNAHLTISIWPDFGPDTPQHKDLEAIGALYPFKSWPTEPAGVQVYDVFNEQARQIYWDYLKGLLDTGVDALWSDSTEPDHIDQTEEEHNYITAAGSWRSVKLAFPLMTNMGIYDNYRKDGYTKRAMQMTRSASFGIQRYATLSWSGDVFSTWEVFKAQIPSGLDYTLCGIPYWNTDIGGFFNWWYEGGAKNPELQELQVRWMQWSVFVPIMRNHTSGPLVNEIYRFGDPGSWQYDCQLAAVKLRYKILPYIYSLAGLTVLEDGLLMRPLVMDFASDRTALSLSDEYMFGPAFLVHPVTDPQPGLHGDVASYLPAGSDWYDFETGERLSGGQWFTRDYTIAQMPVFVRAGSIIPFGPDVQWSSEKPWDSLEVAVYPGADGHFALYEDEGDGYGYENGAWSMIDFKWDDAASTLTIAARRGSFPGMLATRSFVIEVQGKAPQTVEYSGEEVSVSFQ